jgi:hypothetical protein
MQSSVSRLQKVSLLCFALISASTSLWAADMTPAELIAKHLDSIGSAQTRGAIKSRVVQGPATYRILAGGTGAIDGRSVFASEGDKSNVLLKIDASGYRGEQFICDGKKISVAGTYADKTRSELGNFVLGQDVIVRELLGGVWSVGWPLLDIEGRKAQVHYEGSRKVDGRELLVLRYRPRKGTDLDILMYFDPATYQHVMTAYKASRQTGLGRSEVQTARRSPTYYEIEERFSDFRTADGLTLPTHYDLRFTAELQSGFTKSVEWSVKATNIMNNTPIDERSFEVK